MNSDAIAADIFVYLTEDGRDIKIVYEELKQRYKEITDGN